MAFSQIRRRGAAGWFFTIIGGSVLAPMVNLWRSSPRDSFPFSHYPMFSSRRGSHLEVAYVRGQRPCGTYVTLDSRLVARGGMNQERKQIARAARRRRADGLARKAARRLAERGSHSDVTSVEIVIGQFPLGRYFDEGPLLPDRVNVVATCDVPSVAPRVASDEPGKVRS